MDEDSGGLELTGGIFPLSDLDELLDITNFLGLKGHLSVGL